MNEKLQKIEGIRLFLKYSLLFSIDSKKYILSNLENFSDDQIKALGDILIYEHDNRESLDKETAISFMNELGRVINQDKNWSDNP